MTTAVSQCSPVYRVTVTPLPRQNQYKTPASKPGLNGFLRIPTLPFTSAFRGSGTTTIPTSGSIVH